MYYEPATGSWITPHQGLGASPALERETTKEQRILGLKAETFFKVAIPLVGGLFSAAALIVSYKKGGERWAVVLLASGSIAGAFTSAATALQEGVWQDEAQRLPPGS